MSRILRTTGEGHIEYHKSRQMFCVKNDEIIVAPPNIALSHLEWFEQEGWIIPENQDEFLKTNPRGYYDEKQNRLYCYKEIFIFDEELISLIRQHLPELKRQLSLNNKTEINFGPRDEVINGVRFERLCIGKLEDMT